MDTRIYPLDLPEVKAYLSMNPEDTSQDPFLTDCIAAVCDELAQWLPFSIIERDASLTVNLRWQLPGRPVTVQLTSPVLNVAEVSIRNFGGETVVLSPDQWILDGSTLCISGLPPSPEKVMVRYRVGSDVPPAIRSALLMMCKNRYERRDEGTMTEAVWNTIRPYMRINI